MLLFYNSTFSPLAEPPLPMLHNADAVAMRARCERVCFADALGIIRLHVDLSAKLPQPQAGAHRRLRDAGDDAMNVALAALAPGAAQPCRGALYDELFAPSRAALRLAAAAEAAQPLPCVPQLAAVRAAACSAWHAQGRVAPRVTGNGWYGDMLDGAPLVRHVAPLWALLSAAAPDSDGASAPPALLAWARRSPDGAWLLTDATGSVEAAPEGAAAAEWAHPGKCLLLRHGHVVVEGGRDAHAAAGAPGRVYVAFDVLDAKHIAALDAERPPVPRWAPAPAVTAAVEAVASLAALLIWRRSGGQMPGHELVRWHAHHCARICKWPA
jgi:hypothetical protein